MSCLEDVLNRLSQPDVCGYHADSICATEPAALTAIALIAHQRQRYALPLVDWLLTQQGTDGSVGVEDNQSTPGWATAWAVIAWQAAFEAYPAKIDCEVAAEKGLRWLVAMHGAPTEKSEWIAHDTSIDGWPWVQGTHAWVEPTAINLLALKRVGRGDHPRARDAVRLLQDRMLSTGGSNYGNTVVLGQELVPHLQPTGLSLLALAGERDTHGRIASSGDYLLRELSARTATASLCYGLLGLAAQNRTPDWAIEALETAAKRTLARDPAGYKLALLALALPGVDSPLITDGTQDRQRIEQL